LKQLFEDLRYPVKTRGLGDLRGLPLGKVQWQS